MSRPGHHPQCALSQDVAGSATERVPGYRAPKCTCAHWRREQTRIRKAKEKALKQRELRGVDMPDGTVGLGNGNYWRAPALFSDSVIYAEYEGSIGSRVDE